MTTTDKQSQIAALLNAISAFPEGDEIRKTLEAKLAKLKAKTNLDRLIELAGEEDLDKLTANLTSYLKGLGINPEATEFDAPEEKSAKAPKEKKEKGKTLTDTTRPQAAWALARLEAETGRYKSAEKVMVGKTVKTPARYDYNVEGGQEAFTQGKEWLRRELGCDTIKAFNQVEADGTAKAPEDFKAKFEAALKAKFKA